MKVTTFNTQHCLNYLEDKIDFDVIAKAIIDCDGDVVGLNEMRGQGEAYDYTAQTEKLAALAGFPHYYFAPALQLPNLGPYGNAILSKIPILKAEIIPIPDPNPKAYDGYYETRCILKAELEGGIVVLISHFGLNPDEQENAVKTVLANIADKKCILMGDFNMQPNNPILAPIFAKMKDTASCFTQEKKSYPSDNPNEKIDYIFVSSDVEVLDADIPAIVASDHRPHTASLKL